MIASTQIVLEKHSREYKKISNRGSRYVWTEAA